MKHIFFLLGIVGIFMGCATARIVDEEDSGDPMMMPGTDASSCTSKCDGGCTDLKTDNSNCGKCGTVCPQGATCVQGSCQCPSGQTKCGNACVDTKLDNANCGACGKTCGGADAGVIMGGGMYACVNGACAIQCPQPKVECNGACVDTKTDNNNCGMCGNTCVTMTEQCSEGMCCKTGQKVCNNMCTDVLSDPSNCGMCGKVCPMNTPSCSNGMCTTSMLVQIFPPNGTLQDPGASSVWSARYYTMKFSVKTTIVALSWKANLANNDFIRAEVWDPQSQQKLATGNQVNGSGVKQYYKSPLNFVAQANTNYLVGVFMSNSNTVFPRKDSPTYPFTVGNITISACWSTSTSNTDIFPTSPNSWAPDFQLEIQ